MRLAGEVYKLTSQFPDSEKFGLISQMQRAAVAIPSNIAEGSKRNHRAEYLQFLAIASGSAAELETQLLLARDLFRSKIDFGQALNLTEEILKMLYSFMSAVKKN